MTKVCYAHSMRRIGLKLLNFILVIAFAWGVAAPLAGDGMMVHASTIKEQEDEVARMQEILEQLEDQVDSLIGEQDVLYEQIDDLNAEIINVLASIALLEEEIVQKEQDIAVKQQEYEEAKKVQEEQEAAMAQRIKLSYEQGSTTSLWSKILEGFSFAEILNRVTYAESVYDYDSKMLRQYEQTKNEVHQMWEQLETEKANLQADKVALEEEKKYCDELKAELQAKAEDYDTLIAQAEKDAKTAKQNLKKEQQELERMKEEERRKKAREEAMEKEYDTDYNELIDASYGSELGKQIAKFGCQYIGNKYVYGGTSLENGIDCSGFTYRVYQNFGYDLPRTSYSQRSCGVGVNYEDAQPGDIICYSGHVGIYIGGGYIVHASNSKPYPQGGIKVNKANYRTILAVRRIVE